MPLLIKSSVLPYDETTDDGVDGDGATVPSDNTTSTNQSDREAKYVLDVDDLSWTVVNRGSNKSKTRT